MRNHSYLVPILLALFSGGLFAQESVLTSQITSSPAKGEEIRSVFVNVTGDERFSKRVWAYMELEFEDVGIMVVTAENKADAVVSIDVKRVEEIGHIAYGVRQVHVTSQNGAEKREICGSISSDQNATTNLFESTGETIAGDLRERYPNAKTISIDKTSDLSVAPKMGEQLNSELALKGFTLSEGSNADLAVWIALIPRKQAIQQTIAEYKYEIRRRGQQGGVMSGNGRSIFKASVSSPPIVCPARFFEMKWLEHGNSALFELAQIVVKGVAEK